MAKSRDKSKKETRKKGKPKRDTDDAAPDKERPSLDDADSPPGKKKAAVVKERNQRMRKTDEYSDDDYDSSADSADEVVEESDHAKKKAARKERNQRKRKNDQYFDDVDDSADHSGNLNDNDEVKVAEQGEAKSLRQKRVKRSDTSTAESKDFNSNEAGRTSIPPPGPSGLPGHVPPNAPSTAGINQEQHAVVGTPYAGFHTTSQGSYGMTPVGSSASKGILRNNPQQHIGPNTHYATSSVSFGSQGMSPTDPGYNPPSGNRRNPLFPPTQYGVQPTTIHQPVLANQHSYLPSNIAGSASFQELANDFETPHGNVGGNTLKLIAQFSPDAFGIREWPSHVCAFIVFNSEQEYNGWVQAVNHITSQSILIINRYRGNQYQALPEMLNNWIPMYNHFVEQYGHQRTPPSMNYLYEHLLRLQQQQQGQGHQS